MKRKWLAIPALLVAAGMAAYAWQQREPREPTGLAATPVTSAAPAPAAAAAPTTTADPAVAGVGGTSPEDLARWSVDVNSADAAQRAAAINGLAQAPSTSALPILQNVLNSGEVLVDRPLAMQSLRTLALREGDANGVIRGMLRQAIYHAEVEDVARQAQSVLDDLDLRLNRPAT
jgi:hypothetical protein